MIRPTRALIDRTALAANIAVLRQRLAPGVRIMGIAKADCYGHGADLCIPVMRACGIDIFGVATSQEGVGLRALGLDEPIVVLPPPLEGEYGIFAEFNLEAVISNAAMAEALDAAGAAAGRRLAVHIFVDTGMGRNGAAPAEVVDLLRLTAKLPHLHIVGIASHLATSDETANPFTREQLASFDATLRGALDAGFVFRDVHIANSGGILNFSGSQHNLVRPGIALYGFHPSPELQSTSGLAPVMTLRTIVGNLSRMPAGASISYGRRYRTAAPTTIATLPIGYADGLMRGLSGNLEVLLRGQRFSVVGTICMDEVAVDLGDADGIARGDEVVLIGTQGGECIDGWELAQRAGTIPYEICTNISRRVPRLPLQA